jgi:hypothetical protein
VKGYTGPTFPDTGYVPVFPVKWLESWNDGNYRMQGMIQTQRDKKYSKYLNIFRVI